jgi:hypothetical protein
MTMDPKDAMHHLHHLALALNADLRAKGYTESGVRFHCSSGTGAPFIAVDLSNIYRAETYKMFDNYPSAREFIDQLPPNPVKVPCPCCGAPVDQNLVKEGTRHV